MSASSAIATPAISPGPPVSYDSYDYAGTAAQALVDLDEQYARWIDGIRTLSVAGLAERCREPGFETDSMAAMILHIHREVIHHGAEIALLRDLYRSRGRVNEIEYVVTRSVSWVRDQHRDLCSN